MRLIFAGAAAVLRSRCRVQGSERADHHVTAVRGGRPERPWRKVCLDVAPTFDAQRNEFSAYVLPRRRNAVRADARQLQDVRDVDAQGRDTRPVGRRHRPDHLRRASDRISRGRRRDAVSAPDHPRVHVLAVRADRRVRDRARSARHRDVLRPARARCTIASSRSSSTSRSTTPPRRPRRCVSFRGRC